MGSAGTGVLDFGALWRVIGSDSRLKHTPDAPQAPALAPAALPAAESQQLRRALKRMTRRLTGRVVWDSAAGLYVPEVKPENVFRPPEVLKPLQLETCQVDRPCNIFAAAYPRRPGPPSAGDICETAGR